MPPQKSLQKIRVRENVKFNVAKPTSDCSVTVRILSAAICHLPNNLPQIWKFWNRNIIRLRLRRCMGKETVNLKVFREKEK